MKVILTHGQKLSLDIDNVTPEELPQVLEPVVQFISDHLKETVTVELRAEHNREVPLIPHAKLVLRDMLNERLTPCFISELAGYLILE